MTAGAAVVALLGLGVGCAGMWLAWRLVRAAAGEGQAPDRAAAEEQIRSAAEEEPAPLAGEEHSVANSPAGAFSPTGAWGQIGAVLALGGVCLLIPALFNIASAWPLAVGGLVAIALGLALLSALVLRKRRRNTLERPLERPGEERDPAAEGGASKPAKPR